MSFSRIGLARDHSSTNISSLFIIENIKNQFSNLISWLPISRVDRTCGTCSHNQLGLKFITNRCLPDVNCLGLALTFYDIRIKQSFDRALK